MSSADDGRSRPPGAAEKTTNIRRRKDSASVLLGRAVLVSISLSIASVAAAGAGRPLQLDVTINGQPAGLIGSFVELADGRIAAKRNELEELGIHATGSGAAEEPVPLDAVPTLRYRIEEKTQAIFIEIANGQRAKQRFDLRLSPARKGAARADWGAVLNYDLNATAGSLEAHRLSSLGSTALTVEARGFSPYGTVEQSALLRAIPQQAPDLVRLDTAFRHSDEERQVSYQAGDLISGGLPWSRPLRLGGFQAQSNFALRPDLVRMPLPSIEGSAAVPSTVEVYVNSIRAFSKDVAAGPFSVSNIPVISGSGEAQLVIRDAAGRETRTVVPFFASPSLLARGETDWSVEAGLPRRSYGSTADGYTETPVGSATLRGGLSDWLTLQGHAEGGGGLYNAGLGAVTRSGGFGVAALAVSGSNGPAGNGFQTYFAFETKLLDITVDASSQMTFGAYDDLASVTANMRSAGATSGYDGAFGPVQNADRGRYPYGRNATRPPRQLARLSVGAPLPFDDRSSLSANFIHVKDASGNRSDIVSGSYSRALPLGASLYGTIFRDFGTQRTMGFVIGLSIPFGDAASLSSGFSRSGRSRAASVDIVRSLGTEARSYGWRVHDAEGASPYREATVSYRSRYGTIQAGASRDASRSAGSLGLRGSIAALDGDVFASDWIDDGFAVVKVGAPGVDVLAENRKIGVTDASGSLLVPSLRAYDSNRIALDPANLPVDTDVETARTIVSPADRAGVVVDFRVRSTTNAALVSFRRADGAFVPVGSSGRMADGGSFVVGYDGEAFIRALTTSNVATIETGGGPCEARFAFEPAAGRQVRIAAICR